MLISCYMYVLASCHNHHISLVAIIKLFLKVCSFAKGLGDGAIDSAPGFCCLDAPYQSKPNWGEKVRTK